MSDIQDSEGLAEGDDGVSVMGPRPLPRGRSRLALGLLAAILGLMVGVWGCNEAMVSGPVRRELASDTRNSGFVLAARYQHYFEPATLVLDLQRVESATPADLFRGFFQSAACLHGRGRRFDRVILARSGRPVFLVKGDDFWQLGSDFGAGENPVFLIRTWPEHLYRPSGFPAFARWEGGLLGVLGKQMEDAVDAANAWAAGGVAGSVH